MIHYFTFRPFLFNGAVLTPEACIKANFPGLNLEYAVIGGDNALDGRYLASIEYSGDIPDSEMIGILAEGLAAYSYHAKTPESALAFLAAYDFAYTVDGDGVLRPSALDAGSVPAP